MKPPTILLILVICFLYFKAISQIDDKTKYAMFCSACDNSSTAPNYVVVTVKNLNTKEEKEICTEAPFLSGAVDREAGTFTWNLNCKKYKDRYFEFSNDSALWNISFDLYTKTDLDNSAKSINIQNIVEQVKSGNLTNKTFTGDRKEQIMFAHLMFNNGIMMTRGCIAGNLCNLTYFKSQ